MFNVFWALYNCKATKPNLEYLYGKITPLKVMPEVSESKHQKYNSLAAAYTELAFSEH